MELKKGFVYEVKDDANKYHPVVVMDTTCEKGRIKAVAFTHNEVGSDNYPNEPFPKEFVIECDSNGCKYEFQWEKRSRGRTSIIKTGFLKSLEIVDPKAIGQITEEGLEWIREQVKGNYDIVEGHISMHCRNMRTRDNERHD